MQWLKYDRYQICEGDCIPVMHEMQPDSIDFAVYSPPFPSVYAYTDSPSDLGNSDGFRGEAKLHLSFFYRAIRPLIKPGRVMVVHVTQIPRMKRSGEYGLFDFRGLNIRLAERAGFIFDYDWMIRKNPQSQAIRSRSRELQFAGLESDRANSRGALPDYLLKFKTPGENAVAIDDPDQVSRDEWIAWAEANWGDIRETDTLNGEKGKKAARSESDTKHICPLQLPVIERLIRLYSDPGELVLSPFMGIGSEGHEALRLGRRFSGIELKPEYFAAASRNLAAIAAQSSVLPHVARGSERLTSRTLVGQTSLF